MVNKCSAYFLSLLIISFGFSTDLAYAADSVSDNLTGGPTYDRIFTGDVDPDCNATSTLSGVGVGVEYAVIPIHTGEFFGENLVANVNPTGTGITDTTISLYCEFDPADATLNLVAFDDDDGAGLLSAFDGSEGALLKYAETYWLVLSLFAPGTIGDGSYQIDFGGKIRVGAFRAPVAPTLSKWGVIILSLVLIGSAIISMGRQQKNLKNNTNHL